MHRQLIVIAGPEKGRTFSLEDGQTLLIGRGQQSPSVRGIRRPSITARTRYNNLDADWAEWVG
jgi:hypothetical protein